MDLYPFTFYSIYKDKIWGGDKIRTVLGKDFGNLPNCGETWELSSVADYVSVIKNGSYEGKKLSWLIEEYGEELLGKELTVRTKGEFPLLIKFIDAQDDLSIQVHPDDDLARKRNAGQGKTEMWYVIQADPNAHLISGFNREVAQETYLEYLQKEQLEEILNFEKVQADDVFFMPAGRVHSIGKGILLTEIQQTSDTTYRIYDFNRVDDQGRSRDLHTEEALEAIDFHHYPDYRTSYDQNNRDTVNLVTCPYFTTNRIYSDQNIMRDYSHLDSFVVYIGLEGEVDITCRGGNFQLKRGDVYLIPAALNQLEIITSNKYKLLECYWEG